MKKRYIILISICVILFILGLLGMIYKYTNGLNGILMHPKEEPVIIEEPKIEEPIEDEEKEIEINLSTNSEYLYRIFYSKYDKKYNLLLYDIVIKKNTDVMVGTVKINKENIENLNNEINLYNSTSLFNGIVHENVELNDEQKVYIIEYLNNEEYNTKFTNLTSMIVDGGFYVINYSSKSGFLSYERSIEKDNFYLVYILKDLINNNMKHIDGFIRGYNFKNYIEDVGYDERDINDEEIKSLFKTYNSNKVSFSNYYNEKITNDYKISNTLKNLKSKKDKENNIRYYNKSDFEAKLKELFNTTKYDTSKYNDPNYIYNIEKERFEKVTNTFYDKIIEELIYAYENNDKLVLISRSIYVSGIADNMLKSYYAIDLPSGNYNNINDRIKINGDIVGNHEYTYYRYELKKLKSTGKYYLKSFSKLN